MTRDLKVRCSRYLAPNHWLTTEFLDKTKKIGPDPLAILAIGLTGTGLDMISALVGIRYGRFLYKALTEIKNNDSNINLLLVIVLSLMCYRATAGLWSMLLLKELQRIDSEFKG